MINARLGDKRPRKNYGKFLHVMPIPNLIEVQKRSYARFLQADVPPEKREDIGLQSVFVGVFPISDFKNISLLEFVSYHLGDPKYSTEECRQRGMSYAAPLRVRLRLKVGEKDKDTGAKAIKEIKEQEIYLGELPLMTEQGTFIINGTERTVVSQMHRSPGAFFDTEKVRDHTGFRPTYIARIIPYRGSWLEFELSHDGLLHLRIDRRRKLLGTVFLRAWGLDKNEQIFSLFYSQEEILLDSQKEVTVKLDSQLHIGRQPSADIKSADGKVLVTAHTPLSEKHIRKLQSNGVTVFPINFSELLGRVAGQEIVAEDTGEILIEAGQTLDEQMLAQIAQQKTSQFKLLISKDGKLGDCLFKTLAKDRISNKRDALIEIYKRIRPGDPPTIENASYLFKELFSNPKRYDLSRVGRLKINRRVGLNLPLEARLLTLADIVSILKTLMQLAQAEGPSDDIDHLGNRRVRSVGELLDNQLRVGMMRMERAIKERMSIHDLDVIMPHNLINAKSISAAVKEFFGSSQLSQFMDKTNPLAELTHKRRLSALGPGGLSRERAGFEARDVHPSHYGRICPIETPEGPNIGLISSLSTYARVNDFGFIETPYRKVEDGRATDRIVYLTAMDEEEYTIAQANAPIDKDGHFTVERVAAREGGEFAMVPPEKVDYMDVSPMQLVSVSTALIPFLENDDANRALMGSNMQRQAVPLLKTDAPLVGTGMEEVVARDSGAVLLAKRSGVVESVNANRIIIRAEENMGKDDTGIDVYTLTKFQRSNQNTCINQKPIVRIGDRVERRRIIADGPGTDQGELALGQNVLVAFVPWCGYNFEDAVIVSEKLVKDDRYTSIHIEEFEIEARETKLGKEEITCDIPNVGEEALRNLDESGVIRTGAEVKPGNILVGKVTPKGETQLTPEEKLLRAIFGEKAGDVRDASLTVPPGIEGIVVDVKIFSRKGADIDKRAENIENIAFRQLEKNLHDEIRVVKVEGFRRVKNLLCGQTLAEQIIGPAQGEVLASQGIKLTGDLLDNLKSYFWKGGEIKVSSRDIRQTIAEIRQQVDEQINLLRTIYGSKLERLGKKGELSPGVIKMVRVYVAMKRKLSVGDKMAGRHGNKGVIAKIVPEEDMPYLPDGTPIEIILNPLGVPSRMNVGQILETHLGWAAKTLGIHVKVPVFEGASEEEIKNELVGCGLSPTGKTILYDGRTGEPFDQEVTVGYIYIMKLSHLVDDKIHARSIGPYSLVTRQPLGGKAQFGGQRFGEMEVWALEAYGAAYTLQEMLTVKSDYVHGRTKAYESIVKGENISTTGIPESFNVLIKELQSLCLDIELIGNKKETLT